MFELILVCFFHKTSLYLETFFGYLLRYVCCIVILASLMQEDFALAHSLLKDIADTGSISSPNYGI